MGGEGDFNDDIFKIDSEHKSSNKSYITSFIIGGVVLLLLITGGIVFISTNKPVVVSKESASDIAEAKVFIQDFVLHFYNLSAGFFEGERDKASKYMSNEVLAAYQKSFYDQKLLERINKHNLATSFDIQRLDFIAKGKTEYQFKVIGNIKFTSLRLGTYVQFPFTHTINVVKGENGFKISNIMVE